MITLINDEVGEVSVPESVHDLDSFRTWSDSADFPEHGRIWWLRGSVWVDMSKEQIFTHVSVKTEFTVVLGGLAKRQRRGIYLADGAFLTHEAADISGNPDGIFVLLASLRANKVRLIEGARGGWTEIAGSPDMVLEIVSEGSQAKDTVTLREAYWEAGIREYWLVDTRKQPLRFDILRHTAKGYVATSKQAGWIKSAVFGQSFRLRQSVNLADLPEYTLEVR